MPSEEKGILGRGNSTNIERESVRRADAGGPAEG